MKVLMFGWEFPPHISGGLGTACAGLTHALEKEKVEVLFVVPKLYGGEQDEGITFINASSIPIRQKQLIKAQNGAAPDSESGKDPVSPSPAPYVVAGSKPNHNLIEIPSWLSPYTTTSQTESSFGVEEWNYPFEQNDRTIPADLRSIHKRAHPLTKRQSRYVKEPYRFSGSYGSSLLEEVDRYAQVGEEIARRYSFDIIHAHDWMTYRAGIAAKKISGKPLIVHVHSTEIDRSGANVNAGVFAIEKEGMTGADKVVTVSNWTKNIAVQHYQVDEKKIEVVHNGITPKALAAHPSGSTSLGSQIVTFLGRITYQKGPMYFVEAARKVHEKFPDTHFVVAGSGDQLPRMLERIAQLRLSSYFHFTGFLKADDIDCIWSMSSVYVMPSVSEPFGIAPLEAIQAGVPVILSNQAGVSEVMPHAIKVDFWNSEALAEAICQLLRYKSLASTLKKNGAEQVKGLTWDKAAKKLITLYYELSTTHDTTEKSDLVFSGSPAKKTADPALL